MSTPYEDVYKSFLNKIEDADLPRFGEHDQQEMLLGWFNEAMAMMDVRNIRLRADLQARDNDLMEFDETLSYTEIEIISMFMVAAWYSPKINSLETTLLMSGHSGDKWSSQKDHLTGMKASRDYWIASATKLCRDRNVWGSSYFTDE